MSKPFDILLIEDTAGDADYLEIQLKQVPIVNNIITVTTKKEGLELLRRNENHFGLVISNYITAEGKDYQKELIEQSVQNGTPFIFLSGINSAEYSSQAFRDGAIAFLEKPLDLGQFMGIIKMLDTVGIQLVEIKPENFS